MIKKRTAIEMEGKYGNKRRFMQQLYGCVQMSQKLNGTNKISVKFPSCWF
jgi:hypothetical protein